MFSINFWNVFHFWLSFQLNKQKFAEMTDENRETPEISAYFTLENFPVLLIVSRISSIIEETKCVLPPVCGARGKR